MILKNYDRRSIEAFSSDLIMVMNILKRIDVEYANAKAEFIHDFAHLKKLLKDWNRKYPLLHLTPHETGMQLKIKVIIQDSFRNVLEVASHIDNLVSVNSTDLNINKSEIINALKDNETVNFSYRVDDDENTLSLHRDNHDHVEIIYPLGDMITTTSPEFKLCAYYALKEVKDINLHKLSNFFSFDTDEEEEEGKGISYLNRVRLFDRM